MAVAGPPEEWRVAMCEWLTANGIDPNTVPLHSSFSISQTPDGNRIIHYSEYVLTDDGHKQVAPDSQESPGEAWERSAVKPCTVEPPAWLNVQGGRA